MKKHKKSKWISVVDALPEYHRLVLAYLETHVILIAIRDEVNGFNIFYSNGMGLESEEIKVTHWRKLPKGPYDPITPSPISPEAN